MYIPLFLDPNFVPSVPLNPTSGSYSPGMTPDGLGVGFDPSALKPETGLVPVTHVDDGGSVPALAFNVLEEDVKTEQVVHRRVDNQVRNVI